MMERPGTASAGPGDTPRRSRRSLRVPWILSATVSALFLALPPLAAASPQSKELTRQGAADLAARQFEGALRKFEAAAQADPNDAEAFFFQGVALNRLGRPIAALQQLDRAAALKYDHPDFGFEVGWSLLGLGRYADAIASLEAYDRARPGRGQTSEFMGRAYLALRQFDKAEAAFQEALRRDPSLKPTVLYSLAVLERRRQNLAASREYLERLGREAPESPLTHTLREQLARTAPPAVRPFSLTLTGGAGYNTNVIALGQGAPLPLDISSKGSGFTRFTLDAAYTWRITPSDTLVLAYGFQADTYFDLGSFDGRDHLGSVTYARRITDRLAATLRVSDQYSEVGGNGFRNQFAARPAFTYRLTDWAVAEVAYEYALSDYTQPFLVPQVQDRDATTHTVFLTGYLNVPGTQLRGRVGYFHRWNYADGGDYDFRSNGVQVGLSHPLVWQITADLSYTHTFDRYLRNTSTAPSASPLLGFGFRRKDDGDALTLFLSRPIADKWRAYARYDFTNNDSNIGFFKFDQHVWSAGLVWSLF